MGNGDYKRGMEWCQFCKAEDRRERAYNLNSKFDFQLPPLLTDEDVEEILAASMGWSPGKHQNTLQAAVGGKVGSG